MIVFRASARALITDPDDRVLLLRMRDAVALNAGDPVTDYWTTSEAEAGSRCGRHVCHRHRRRRRDQPRRDAGSIVRPIWRAIDFDGSDRLEADTTRELSDCAWWFDTVDLTPEETAERLVAETAPRPCVPGAMDLRRGAEVASALRETRPDVVLPEYREPRREGFRPAWASRSRSGSVSALPSRRRVRSPGAAP